MDQQEVHNSTDTASLTQTIWETLTAAQQATVLQTLVRICCQITEQWMPEVQHESIAE